MIYKFTQCDEGIFIWLARTHNLVGLYDVSKKSRQSKKSRHS